MNWRVFFNPFPLRKCNFQKKNAWHFMKLWSNRQKYFFSAPQIIKHLLTHLRLYTVNLPPFRIIYRSIFLATVLHQVSCCFCYSFYPTLSQAREILFLCVWLYINARNARIDGRRPEHRGKRKIGVTLFDVHVIKIYLRGDNNILILVALNIFL